MTPTSVTYTQTLPVRIAEWLTEHGYAVAKSDGNGWKEAPGVEASDRSIGVIHGLSRRWPWSERRRVVGNIELWNPSNQQVLRVYIFGNDAVASLFKRQLEELASTIGLSIEASQTTTINVEEYTG